MKRHRLSGKAGIVSSLKKVVKYSHCLMCDKTLFLVDLAKRSPCDTMFCDLSCSHKAENRKYITKVLSI